MVEDKNGALVVTRETKGLDHVYLYTFYSTIIMFSTYVPTLSSSFIFISLP